MLTPKQVARALDASESSVKRWCDKGVIPTQYTAGGHRRITMSGLLAFLREGKHELVHPEALGLPTTNAQTVRVLDGACEQMTSALLDGNEPRCRQIAIDLYLANYSMGVICDDIFAAAFREIGDRWSCGDAEVYQERLGCETSLRVLHELRSLLPGGDSADAPLAIGGATSGDQYDLGTTMAELVLRGAKWNATSLGNNLPFETLASAIREWKPKLFWLSCSYIPDETEFLEGYRKLQQEFGSQVAFVVGGFALTHEVRQKMQFSSHGDNMQHLEGFATTLRAAIDNKST